MSTMIIEIYDALKEAGASEEKAIAAAKALADYENHFIRLESKIDAAHARQESELNIVKAELSIIKWLIGFLVAGVISIIIRTFLR